MKRMRLTDQKVLDSVFLKFIFVGVINTLVGTAIMFLFYNVFHFSYWVSSASNYVFGSILSYVLNKTFTFKNTSKSAKTVVRFVINITLCYLIAYGAAKPIVRWLFQGLGTKWQDNLAMVAGMGLFVILNYIGQRFWAFKEENNQ